MKNKLLAPLTFRRRIVDWFRSGTATIRVKATVTTPVGMDKRTWLDNVGHKKLVANPCCRLRIARVRRSKTKERFEFFAGLGARMIIRKLTRRFLNEK